MTDRASGVDPHGISADPVDDDVPDTARMLPEGSSSSDNAGVEVQHTAVNVQNHDDEGEDAGRDNSLGAEAQNLLVMQSEIARPMSFLGFLRYLSSCAC
jgi:hypothetical protein